MVTIFGTNSNQIFLVCLLVLPNTIESMIRLSALGIANSNASSYLIKGIQRFSLLHHPSSVSGVEREMRQAAIKPVTLITLDVDGTLVQGSSNQAEYSAHARAFSHAIGKVFLNDNTYEVKYPSPLMKIPPSKYHGSTDGLIALNYAKYDLQISPENTHQKLPQIFRAMYAYYATMSDEEAVRGIGALPGVIETLSKLHRTSFLQDHFLCGLVTGNVEGIARKKMRGCGIFQTGVLSGKASDQNWDGENDSSFLGGFGSDFCSGNIDDVTRMYKDRAEQIAIAVKRAQSMLTSDKRLVRVVHVGDAPSDVLAARHCAEENFFGDDVEVGCIGVATGKFSEEELTSLIGTPIPRRWDPVVLKHGLSDPLFIEKCKIYTSFN